MNRYFGHHISMKNMMNAKKINNAYGCIFFIILQKICFFMKKLFKALLCIIAVLLIAVAVIWNGELRTLAGIKQVGDDPYLFSGEYEARYDLDALVEAGIDENAILVSFIIVKLSRGLYKLAPAE